MRGHTITENRFLHTGIDHRLFVTRIENEEKALGHRLWASGNDEPRLPWIG